MQIENSVEPRNHVKFIFPAMVAEHFCWDLVRVKLLPPEHWAVLIILLVPPPDLHVGGSGGLNFNFDLFISHYYGAMLAEWLILEVYCKSVLLYGQVRYLAAAGIDQTWPTPVWCHVTNYCKLRGTRNCFHNNYIKNLPIYKNYNSYKIEQTRPTVQQCQALR